MFAATEAFAGTGVSITTQGKVVLGCPIGIDFVVSNFISSKISEWSTQLLKLPEIAITQPHTAFSAFTRGLFSRWTYLCRVHSFQERDLLPIKDAHQAQANSCHN